jgi:hypothetical protein
VLSKLSLVDQSGSDFSALEWSYCRLPLDNVITAEDRQMRLPWWGILCVILGALSLLILFDHFGKLTLARPSLTSAAMVIIAIAMRWKLKRHVWFWITMVVLAALHVPVVLLVPWTTKWVPAFAIIPIGVADLYIMLWVLSFVGNLVKRSTISKT